jgi:hypothetical protein
MLDKLARLEQQGAAGEDVNPVEFVPSGLNSVQGAPAIVAGLRRLGLLAGISLLRARRGRACRDGAR